MRRDQERGSLEQWERKVGAFKASRHFERRDVVRTYPDTAWGVPCPREGEREVLAIYASHWLLEVLDPPGWGFRLVGLVVDGQSLTWDLPGYSRREAEAMCVNLIDGYL